MIFQVSVPFRRVLVGVARIDPTQALNPLPPPPPPAPPAPIAEVPAAPAPSRRADDPPPAPAPDMKVEALLTSLEQLGADLRSQQQKRLDEMQKVAIELAVAIATRLVHGKIANGEFAVENLVRKVVERLPQRQPASIYLHPEDINLLEARVGEGSHPLFNENPDVRLIADPALKRGDCRAETADLTLLSQVEDQLDEIRSGLLEGLEDAQVERRRARPTLVRYPDRRQSVTA